MDQDEEPCPQSLSSFALLPNSWEIAPLQNRQNEERTFIFHFSHHHHPIRRPTRAEAAEAEVRRTCCTHTVSPVIFQTSYNSKAEPEPAGKIASVVCLVGTRNIYTKGFRRELCASKSNQPTIVVVGRFNHSTTTRTSRKGAKILPQLGTRLLTQSGLRPAVVWCYRTSKSLSISVSLVGEEQKAVVSPSL